eukprot:3160187-Amphidinium_carterae.1
MVVDDLALGDSAQSTLEGLCEVLGWEISLKPAKRKVMATWRPLVLSLTSPRRLIPWRSLSATRRRRVEEVSNFVKAVLDK